MPILIQPSSHVTPASVPAPARGTVPLDSTGTSLSARGGEPTLTPELVLATLKLSGATLALSAASQLPIPSGYETAFALLSLDDRALLGLASQLAQQLGVQPSEVSKLLIDLCSYRLIETRASQLGPNVAQSSEQEPGRQTSPDGARQPQLAERLVLLPELSARNEAIARTILGSMAMRDTALDRGFVVSLLDPAREIPAKVDFQFLRSLVLSSSRAHADGALDPGVTFEKRDARAVLARAVQNLAQLLVLPPEVSPRSLREGHALLASRLAEPPQPQAEAEQVLPAQPTRSPLPDLTVEDRKVLSFLYASARAQGGDQLAAVDELAHALAGVRRSEQPIAQAVAGRLAAPVGRDIPRSAALLGTVHSQRTAPGSFATPPAARSTNATGVSSPVASSPVASSPVASSPAASSSAASSSAASPPADSPELRLPPRTPSHLPTAQREPPVRTTAPAHHEQAEPLVPELARSELASYQSLAHLAARSVTAYRSVAPPEVARVPTPINTPPLDLAQALGVSALLRGAQPQPLRRMLARRKRVRPAYDTHHAHETETNDATDPRAGTRSRWQLLLSRRRRALNRAPATP